MLLAKKCIFNGKMDELLPQAHLLLPSYILVTQKLAPI